MYQLLVVHFCLKPSVKEVNINIFNPNFFPKFDSLKKIVQIFVFILSFGMLMSPAMAYVANSFEKEVVMDSCCDDSEKTGHENHEKDEAGDCQHDQNDCCGNNCPNKDCCLHLNVYQPINFQLNSLEKIEAINGFESVVVKDFYKFFHYKELIYSVWQPPKLIS